MLLHESVLLIIPCLIITVVAGTLMGYLLVRILSANGLTYFNILSFYSITDLRCLLNNNTYYNFCYLSKNSMQKFVGGTDQMAD